MVTTVNNAIAAYSSAAGQAAASGLEPRDGGPSFAELMQEAGKSAVDTLRTGEAMSAKAVVGEANITDVVNAVNNAEVTLQTVTTVRDRVVSAYQEILRMPI